ncbi:MAG TPA: hypothetical protein ENN17_07410 [bacterium]|nr:hypothetical protein [bacterium]
MTPCHRLRHLIYDFAEGELDEGKDRKEIQAHLEICPCCSASVKQIRGLRNRLVHMQPVQTSDDFILKLRSRLRQEACEFRDAGRLSLARRRWVPAVGLGVLFLASSILLLDQASVSPADQLAGEPAASPIQDGSEVNEPHLAASETPDTPDVLRDTGRGERILASQTDSSKAQDNLEEVRSRIRTVSY